MAANPFDNPFPNPNLFDIYNDPTVVGRNVLPVWPGGSCNFVDLATGANGARCGCRRFWARPLPGAPTPDSAGWCMCNHHACFHDEGPRDAQPPLDTHVLVGGQENERPVTGREPLSPVVDLLQNNPAPTDLGLDYANLGPNDSLSFIYYDPDALGIDRRIQPAAPSQQPSGTIPDTLDWNQTIQTNPQAPSLAPTHTPRLNNLSQATSTASSNIRYLRPFAGKGLNTLSRPGGAAHISQPRHNSPGPRASPHVQTPVPRGSSQSPHVRHTLAAEAHRPSTGTQPEPRAAQEEGLTREALQNITDTIGGHEQRLDRLETVSFSAGGHEECVEKHDHTDLRVTDLEVRMEEVEKQAARFADRHDDTASQSVASFSTAGTSRPSHSQELYSQLQALQAQVNSLQSILPSPSHAWEIEVVFLPFALKKIWQEIHHFKSEGGQDSDDWTQLQMTHSTDPRVSQSPLHESWADPTQDGRWLLPKACGDKSVIDKRLRSRGLIKTISINGPDARSVQSAMHSAFDPLWREMQMTSGSQMAGLHSSRYMGLLSQWVPLRKIHKDSRLRFLSPAEMLTPATWNVQFLNSVMMRSSEPRLFVTHPDAYLQDVQSYETAWSWKRLQDLTPVRLEDEASHSTGDTNPYEQHWAFQAQLDEPNPVPSPILSKLDKSLTSTTSSSPHNFPLDINRSMSPAVSATGQPYRSSGRRASRPPHIRTASMPLSTHAQQSPSLSRRIVSGGQSRRSSPSVRVTSQFAVTKRRQTRSPSHHRFTPRWTGSPSPMPMAIDRQSAQPTTPFAYATPFSNVPLQEFPRARGNSAVPLPMDDGQDDDGDELFDVQFYEDSDSDETDGGESKSSTSAEMVTHAQATVGHDSQQWQFPEDEPWPGIEDQHQLSDGENVDPRDADQRSDASSQPSEYPSTQNAWPRTVAAGAEFEIHEDDD